MTSSICIKKGQFERFLNTSSLFLSILFQALRCALCTWNKNRTTHLLVNLIFSGNYFTIYGNYYLLLNRMMFAKIILCKDKQIIIFSLLHKRKPVSYYIGAINDYFTLFKDFLKYFFTVRDFAVITDGIISLSQLRTQFAIMLKLIHILS